MFMLSQAFSIYEESISESKAQLQAITLIIRTLQTARVFNSDNYDTLITKAALHGAKLLKKGHQATAVALASHLWWQTEVIGREERDEKVRPAHTLSLVSITHVGRVSRLFTRMESVSSNVYRSLCGSPHRASTKLQVYSFMSMPLTDTYTTSNARSQRYVCYSIIGLFLCWCSYSLVHGRHRLPRNTSTVSSSSSPRTSIISIPPICSLLRLDKLLVSLRE